jgi:hypothetical protein
MRENQSPSLVDLLVQKDISLNQVGAIQDQTMKKSQRQFLEKEMGIAPEAILYLEVDGATLMDIRTHLASGILSNIVFH